MISRRRMLAGMAASAAAAGASPAFGSEFGRFEGEFVGRFVGRAMAVTERPLAFIAPDGARWEAPAGVEVNGASIPRALWSIVGSPFTGDYLRASVVHDHYCVTMERDWRATHLAFWYGCRADGLSSTYANLLYAGVMRFGPRWRRVRGLTGGRPKRIDPEFDQAAFDELRAWVETENPSLSAIENRVE